MTVRRLWAVAALVLGLGALVLAVDAAVAHFPSGLAVLACAILAVASGWFAIRRRGVARAAGLAVAALFLIGGIVVVILEARVLEDILVLACVAATLALARTAFQVHVQLPPARRRHPVLFFNPLSGGGKAERFHLADEARRRGSSRSSCVAATISRALCARGQDGAQALAMAGGDGSQAIVAKVAAELGLPYACIPAGTRNHFALDLGVDREDVVGALDAFVDGGERRVDLAEVNGRVFVNNVSLGLYAEAVQKPGYREAKLRTLLDTVPEALGPEARAPTCNGPARTAGRRAGRCCSSPTTATGWAAARLGHSPEARSWCARHCGARPCQRRRHGRTAGQSGGGSGPRRRSRCAAMPRSRPASTARRRCSSHRCSS